MTLLQRVIRASLATLFVLLAVVEAAWTQATSSPAPLSAPQAATPEDGASNGLIAFAFVVGLLLITGIVVKLYDMKRKREDEAVALQARLSDALLTEPSLAGLAITPTVEVPFGWHPQAVVTIAGTVPTPELRAAALHLGMREMAPMTSDYRIEDRIFVDRVMSRRAA